MHRKVGLQLTAYQHGCNVDICCPLSVLLPSIIPRRKMSSFGLVSSFSPGSNVAKGLCPLII